MGTVSKGWEVRMRNFPPELLVSRPDATESISVTGPVCSLQCAHCGGHYLAKMKPLGEIYSTEDIKGSSCLISGGCDFSGKVQLMGQLEKLAALKSDKRYNFHVGLLNEEEIKMMAPLADVVSFDFLGDQATIKETLKLEKTVADYLRCFRLLKKYCSSVAPHICVGLRGGELSGEREAIRLLAQEGISRLIFIVFIPTRGTEYAGRSAPPVQEVIDLLTETRLLLPTTPLVLGCMRPGGSYRRELDVRAVEAGINGIVQPVREALALAQDLGLSIKENRECCVL